jgi:hypothetical protein
MFIGFTPAIDPDGGSVLAGHQFQTAILVPWSAQEILLETGLSRWVEFTSEIIHCSSSEMRNFHIRRWPDPIG